MLIGELTVMKNLKVAAHATSLNLEYFPIGMATTSGGSNPSEGSMTQIIKGEINHKENAPKCDDLLKPKVHVHGNVRITPKTVVMMHGEPSITWKASKVQSMTI
ncbi:hypothetical protein FXO38_09819 [Capsicum annuum]|nr:hypothetical protein FXO38_09819 [Capsicum annuum]